MVCCDAFALRKRERLPKRGRRKEEKLVRVQRKSSWKVRLNSEFLVNLITLYLLYAYVIKLQFDTCVIFFL